LKIVDFLEEHARLPTDAAADAPLEFVPGAPGPRSPQNDAKPNPAATSFRR
jgi:hypothetical protein